MKQKGSVRVAFCGLTAAVSTVVLLLSVVPVSEIGLPALAGALVIPTVIELNRKYALAVYVATAMLALLIVPSWESKLLYIGFFGYYPILKAAAEQQPRLWWGWAIKLLVFNASMVAIYWLLITFLHLDTAAFTIAGVSMPWLILLLGNGVFVLYDIGLSRCIQVYLQKGSPRLRRLFRF